MTTASTILIIEDEPIIRMGTSAMLEDAGYQVMEACDAREALEVLSAHPEIRVVLTDVQMPGSMDGLSLVDKINTDYPAIKSIVTSGRSGLPEARQCGARFLPKPYSASSVQAVIEAALTSEPHIEALS